MTPATASGVREGAESWFIAMASDRAELWLDTPWRPVGVKTGWLVEELSPGKISTTQKASMFDRQQEKQILRFQNTVS